MNRRYGMSVWTIVRTAALAVAAIGFLFGPQVLAQSPAALNFTTLATFDGTDGRDLTAGVILDSSGNIYGAAGEGGTSGSGCGGYGCGTVFKVDTSGNLDVLYDFTGGSDGYGPLWLMPALDAEGNLYGAATWGAKQGVTCFNISGSVGCGTLWKIAADGTFMVLHSFTGYPDGNFPTGALVRDAAGNLYGVTGNGGRYNNNGTIFKVDTTGTLKILWSFTGGLDGGSPNFGVTLDGKGNLYTATSAGGSSCNCGTIVKLDSKGKLTVLYAFTDSGSYPSALTVDSAGTIYGANIGLSCGSIYSLDTNGTYRVLYNFKGDSDGCNPAFGPLVRDNQGNLYGESNNAGENDNGDVYRLSPDGKLTVLYSFEAGDQGQRPNWGLTPAKGTVFSTQQFGGGYGTVFELSR